MASIFIVSTPIGNLEDFSFRALRILKEVDFILCEDTRTTKKLLDYYKINTSVLSYHQHSQLKKIEYFLDLLKQGKNLALVSDAGTPGISDPGNKLINEIVKNLGNQVKVVPIPGPSALTAAASISGFPMDKFLFLGFPPVKKKRKKFFEDAINRATDCSVIFYESPYRIIKTLNELISEAQKNKKEPEVVLCRELTKKFETVYRGKVKEVVDQLKKGEIKGEFVVIVRIK